MDLTLTLSPIIALLVGAFAIIINVRNTKVNRNVSTAIQLSKEFYQDNEFNRDRISMWLNIENLAEDLFDYDKLVLSFNNENQMGTFSQSNLCALNRAAAFYNVIKGLIEKKEVDIDLLREFFGYNYNKFWEPIRVKFEINTKTDISKSLFRKIPELVIQQ